MTLELNILSIYDRKKYIDPIKRNKDDPGNFETPQHTYEKLMGHILPPLKPYNFCVEQFFVGRII